MEIPSTGFRSGYNCGKAHLGILVCGFTAVSKSRRKFPPKQIRELTTTQFPNAMRNACMLLVLLGCLFGYASCADHFPLGRLRFPLVKRRNSQVGCIPRRHRSSNRNDAHCAGGMHPDNAQCICECIARVFVCVFTSNAKCVF